MNDAKVPLIFNSLAEDTTKTYVFSVGSGKTPNLWMYTFDATTAPS